MKDDKDLTEHFTVSEAAKVAESTNKMYPTVSKKIIDSVKERQDVNARALLLIQEKGVELCSSLFNHLAEKDSYLAAAIQMGWCVGDFTGIAMICNHLAKYQIDEGNTENAVLYRAFAISTLRVGIKHIESDAIEKMMSGIYNVDFGMVNENDWDQAHASFALEQVENEFIWQESQNL